MNIKISKRSIKPYKHIDDLYHNILTKHAQCCTWILITETQKRQDDHKGHRRINTSSKHGELLPLYCNILPVYCNKVLVSLSKYLMSSEFKGVGAFDVYLVKLWAHLMTEEV